MPINSDRRRDRDAPLPDVLQFMQLLWALAHSLERVSKRMAQTLGVTGPQRLVLRVVGLFPGVSAGDLADILHIHPSTLTGMLKRLGTQRLMERSDDPADRRRAVLHLTARGQRANRAGEHTVEAAIAQALKKVSPRDRAATKRAIDQIAAHLDRDQNVAATRPGASRRAKRAETHA